MDGQIPLESSDVADIIVAMSEHNKHFCFLDYIYVFLVYQSLSRKYIHTLWNIDY